MDVFKKMFAFFSFILFYNEKIETARTQNDGKKKGEKKRNEMIKYDFEV